MQLFKTLLHNLLPILETLEKIVFHNLLERFRMLTLFMMLVAYRANAINYLYQRRSQYNDVLWCKYLITLALQVTII